MTKPLTLKVEVDGSISQISGGPLDHTILTGPTAPALDVDRLIRALREINNGKAPLTLLTTLLIRKDELAAAYEALSPDRQP